MLAFWLAMLALLTALRLVVAAASPLSSDEAYYWTWSHALAPGYLDHPPMTALWIHAGTLLCGDTSLGVRLLSPFAAALGTLLLAAACADLLDDRPWFSSPRALAAAVLLNATLLLGVGAVTITPDTPLLLFWTAALAALGRLLATGRGAWWLAAGAAIGLALDSKYTVLLPMAGLAMWLIATRPGRSWLRTAWPWAGLLIAVLLFAPVVSWNALHGWASFLKQGGRAGDWRPADAGRYLTELVLGQAGLATPLIFILFLRGMALLARPRSVASPGRALLLWVTLPAVLVFIQHAIGDRVQANWPSLLYPACAIAAVAPPLRACSTLIVSGRGVEQPLSLCFERQLYRSASALDFRCRLSRRPIAVAAGFGFCLTALVYVQSVAAPLSLPARLDITLSRLAGWHDLARQMLDRRDASDAFIMSDEYGLASELAFALPGHAVLAAEPRWRLFAMPHPDLAGQTGLLLRSARRKDPPSPLLFQDSRLIGGLRRGRGRELAESYRLYRVTVRSDLPSLRLGDFVRLHSPTR